MNIAAMNLRSLDLNLLVVFDAIYEHRNVTRAAETVFLSQPATSNALSRLRHHLKDELFLRSPTGLRPTPRATELAPRLRSILSELTDVLDPQVFDPATTTVSLTIATVDYFEVVVGPWLMKILSREAPGIRARFTPTRGRAQEALDHGDVDFASAAFGTVHERFGQCELLTDSYYCCVRKGHPLSKKKPTLRQYAKASHLLVSPGGGVRGFVDDELAKAGLTREVSLVVDHFAVAPNLVANSDLILTAPVRLLNSLKTPKLVVLESPVSTPERYRFLELIWHDRLSRHPANEWMKNAIIRAAEDAVRKTN